MAPTVEKVSEGLRLGEGPHWDAEAQSLYFVEAALLKSHVLYRYNPSTKEIFSAVLDEPVSLIIPVAGQKDKFIITQQNKIVLATWDGESSKVQSLEVIDIAEPEKKNRFNDGKADPSGRLWAGTMIGTEEFLKKGQASLFSLSADKKLTVQQPAVGLSNGLGWSLDNKTMYYVDTLEGTLDAFDYDIGQGTISNRRVLFDPAKNGFVGSPDGLTVDAEGKIWLAVYATGKVLRIDPNTGKLISTVDIPAKNVTSVTFGGSNLDELYVTSAKQGLNEAELKAEPDSGSVFRVQGLGVKGLPNVPVKLG